MANMTTTNGASFLTIPAGTNWIGMVTLSATLMSLIGAGSVTAFPSVTVSGNGGSLNNGDTVAAVALALPAINLTALVGAQTTATNTWGPMNIQAGSTPISLVLNYGASVTAIAIACGQIQ